MQVKATGLHAPRWRGRLTCAVAGALLMVCGLACVVAGTGTAAGAAIFAGTAVAATLGYRQLTGGCVSSCSKDWHCDHESGLCKPDAHEEPRRLVRPAADAGVPPAREDAYRLMRPAMQPEAPPGAHGEVPPVDAGE